MAYPATRLPVVVEIAPGASPAGDPGDWLWTDVTTSVRIADQITITQGRGDWGEAVDPGECALTFNNTSGDFAQHNPAGQWYGQLGKNTPLRVRLRRVQDTFTRTTSSGWGVADSGQAWSTAGGATSDFSTSGGVGRHAHTTVNALRATTLPVSLLDVEQVFDVSTSAMLTGAALVTGVMARHTAGGYYWLRCEFNAGGNSVMLKISKRVGGTSTDLATLAAVPGLAYSANTPLRVRAAVSGSRLAIKAWLASGPEPAGWQLTTTDSSITTPGAVGFQTWLVGGNTNTLPVVASFDDYRCDVDLFGGYVPAWVPRSDLSGTNRTVPVTARGVLYRLQPGQAKPPPRSALRRTITATSPAAYWPVEDGTTAGQAGSAISGHPPLAVSGTVDFRPVDDYAQLGYQFGTSALADLSAGGRLSATLPATATSSTATRWTVHVAAGGMDPANLSGDVTLMEWTTPGGTYIRWKLLVVKATSRMRLLAYDEAGTEYLVFEQIGISFGFAHRAVCAYQVGPNVTIDLYDGYNDPDQTISTAGTLAGVATITANPTGVTSTVAMPFGHIAVWATTSPPLDFGGSLDSYGTLVHAAWGSWGNEAATSRLRRLTAEDGIELDMPAVTVDGVTRMGWQMPGTLLELYRQCEQVDGGVLSEQAFGLAYTPREGLYNQPVALTLTAQELAQPPEPDDTDQRYRNRWEVSRTDGSSAIAEAPEVAAGALVYDDSATLPLSADDQLSDQASWRLHLTSTSALRWPRLDLNLAATPHLLDDWLSCRIGSRITVTNSPADVAGQDIDVLLEGYQLTLGYKDFRITANCSPAQPWRIATVDGDQRVAADGSTLAAALAEGALTLSLASTAENGPWTTNPADMPLDIRVGGERVTVSAISGSTSPQTATISQRGVNGVTRSWPAGTEVDVWQPAIVPL